MTLEELYNNAVSHQINHDCSAHPYESYQKLFDLVQEYKPNDVLEIGSGNGFSAMIMSLANPSSSILSLEKDEEHFKIAKETVRQHKLDQNIHFLNEVAEEYLPKLTGKFDLIFFDGFQIHYEFLPHYLRLLKTGGILFLGNNHLGSRTSQQFFDELENSGDWIIVEKFAETTVAKRK